MSELLSAFLQVLFDRLARRHVLEFFLGRNFDQTLFEKLKTALQTVYAVLTDAEREQIINLAVQLWVNDLKDAVYQAEDLLDEIATIAKNSRQVCFRFVNPNIQHIESKLKTLVERVVSLANHRDVLKLKGSVRWTPWPTTSLVNQSEVFGRDKDKKKLIVFLLSDNAQDNGIPNSWDVWCWQDISRSTFV